MLVTMKRETFSVLDDEALAYYDHAIKSVDDFYWWISCFMASPERWSGLKSGLLFFGDDVQLNSSSAGN